MGRKTLDTWLIAVSTVVICLICTVIIIMVTSGSTVGYAASTHDGGMFTFDGGISDGSIADSGASSQLVSPQNLSSFEGLSEVVPIKWFTLSSIIIVGIMGVLKRKKILAKLGRARYIILPILSIASALLAEWTQSRSWPALLIVFFGNYCTGQLEELINHGVLGTPHTTKGDSNAS